MRTTHKVCLYLIIGVFLFGMRGVLSGQSTFTFTYGENEEFEGSLTASLIMIGKKKDSGQKMILTQEQQTEIRNFRAEELKTRKRLREVRKILRQDIEILGNQLLAVNILAIPILIALR